MSERIFVTGASGFVGSAVLAALAQRQKAVTALVRGGSIQPLTQNVTIVHGSIDDPASLERAMRGCSAVIHLVGIIMEHPAKGVTFQKIHVEGTRNLVDAARKCEISRYVHMSALGSRANADSTYHQTKYAAEQIVSASPLHYTIIRPSMIHGPRGEFMKMEAKWARKSAPPFLFMPYFGAGVLGAGGSGKLQPVLVDDVANAFADALDNPKTIGKTYELGGTDVMDWPTMHHIVSRQITGKQRAAFPMPAWAGKFYAAIGVGKILGFNRDQVVMSQENNTCDLSPFVSDFGWTPRGFESSLAEYADQL